MLIRRLKEWKRDKENFILNSEKKVNNSELIIFQRPFALGLIIVCAIAADCYTLYKLVELQITQNKAMTITISIVVAAIMNITPSIYSKLLSEKRNRDSKSDDHQRPQRIFLVISFLILFSLSFSLRWFSREEMFKGPNTDVNLVDNSNSGNSNASKEDTTLKMSQNILAILYGVEPLATSIMVFSLSYSVDPKKEKRLALRRENIKLEEKKNNYIVLIQEIEKEQENVDLNEYDNEQYQISQKYISIYEEFLKIHCRRRLAERIGTPESVNYLLEKENKLNNYLLLGGAKDE